MTKIEEAIIFAAKAHAGKNRKNKTRPYILHLAETMSIVMRYASNDDVIIAAVLHDAPNHSSVTISRIEKEFGPRVAAMVESLSEDKMKKLPPEATWRARKWKRIFNLRNADYDTKLIFLADTLSDLRELRRDHERLGDEVWSQFNQKDKKMHAWYYRETLAILEKTFEYEYWEETEEINVLIGQIFGWRID